MDSFHIIAQFQSCILCDQAADLTVEVPVAKVVAVSSTILRWIEIIGERSTVLGINGVFTTSPCTSKRVSGGQILDYSLVAYNTVANQYTVLPFGSAHSALKHRHTVHTRAGKH